MIILIGKVQRALKRHGVTAELATVAQVLSTLEDDGITLAPLQLTPELRALAVTAAQAALKAHCDPYEAIWLELTAHAIPELRRMHQARQAGEQLATDGLSRAGELVA